MSPPPRAAPTRARLSPDASACNGRLMRSRPISAASSRIGTPASTLGTATPPVRRRVDDRAKKASEDGGLNPIGLALVRTFLRLLHTTVVVAPVVPGGCERATRSPRNRSQSRISRRNPSGGGGIRTHGPVLAGQRFSRPDGFGLQSAGSRLHDSSRGHTSHRARQVCATRCSGPVFVDGHVRAPAALASGLLAPALDAAVPWVSGGTARRRHRRLDESRKRWLTSPSGAYPGNLARCESGIGSERSHLYVPGAHGFTVASEHLADDLLHLRIETKVAYPLADRDRSGPEPSLLRQARPDEVLEDELHRGPRTAVVGTAEFLAQSVEGLEYQHLVGLEEIELLGPIEQLRLRLTTLCGTLALDLVRAQGRTPTLLQGEIVRGRAALEPPLRDVVRVSLEWAFPFRFLERDAVGTV